jgi:tetratricopeptide (TPR) repeat protein
MMMRTWHRKLILFGTITVLFLLAFLGMKQVPGVWLRIEKASTWARGFFSPIGELPAPADDIPAAGQALWLPDLLVVDPSASSETFSSVQDKKVASIPSAVKLPSPSFSAQDYQDWNNCGPATLALALRFWGWQGDQFEISELLKPEAMDKNVSPEELAWYVAQQTDGFQIEARMGGTLERAKILLAAGFPVMIEKSFKMEKAAWPGDDLWAGHYLLLTGYDDMTETFITQDSYYGPDRAVPYDVIEKDWQAFNGLFLVAFPSTRIDQAQTAFGVDWQEQENLQRTLRSLQELVKTDPHNSFAWFNLGTTFTDLQEYAQAAEAFDKARQLGLPQRMLRYQFGPFVAAFEFGSLQDLNLLLDYALKITPDSEEALIWKGRAFLLAGDTEDAETLFKRARKSNPYSREVDAALASLSDF